MMEKYIHYINTETGKLSIIVNKLGSIDGLKPYVLVAIIDNYELFIDLTEVDIFLTDNPCDAINSPYNEGVVVYFEQIKLYCSTNHKTYLELSKNLFNKQYNFNHEDIITDMIDEERCRLNRLLTKDEINKIRNTNVKLKSITMQQIVLTTEKQKIIFAFNSNDRAKVGNFYNLLKKLTLEEYGVTTSDDIFEITMFGKIFNNKDEADMYVKKLKMEINKINKEFSNLIEIIQPINLLGDKNYCKYNIDNLLIDMPTDELLLTILKTLPSVNTLILNLGNINNIAGNSNIKTKIGTNNDNMDLLIERWVERNPIVGIIRPSDHVRMFNETHNTNISVSQWGKYVKHLVGHHKSNGVIYYKNINE